MDAWPPMLKFRSSFEHAVRVAQDQMEIEHHAFEMNRKLDWLNVEMQREILKLLLEVERVPADAYPFKPGGPMAQAFRIHIGKAQTDADRAARKSPVVHVTYIDRGVVK